MARFPIVDYRQHEAPTIVDTPFEGLSLEGRQADHLIVKLAAFVAAAALAVLGTALTSRASASPRAGCGSGANGSSGYAYAGQQANAVAHGVRATITALALPTVTAGHVAAWIGVGGKGVGPGGADQWLQTGIAALPGGTPLVYAEVQRAGSSPTFLSLREKVDVGEPHGLAVLEMHGRPNYWRVWVDGTPATGPIHLAGSNGGWKPMATAESWNGGRSVCNTFSFRFEQVGVAAALGGSWAAFKPGYRFLDRGYRVRTLHSGPAFKRAAAGAAAFRPYAFDAQSI